MKSNQLNSSNVDSHLVVLMQGAKEGRPDAMAELRYQLSKYKHPKAMLKHLAKQIKRTEERREEKRASQAVARERYQTNKFAPSNTVFRKSRAKKGAGKTDAFAYRVVLCGGFEMNRRRH
ncbi:hypothetical protein CLH62_00275 [Marinobacter guineae]|uniref:Uncharacterized protein n=1 Tax=Marinobacter guineae TaxID=432303 RepID=A0A2G1VH47_9GAMM|nr:hypothetical protein [Marinobacter guineae]PHQ26086.1 hypothetical protein CLH62_00275 [Marinobacter guineae]